MRAERERKCIQKHLVRASSLKTRRAVLMAGLFVLECLDFEFIDDKSCLWSSSLLGMDLVPNRVSKAIGIICIAADTQNTSLLPILLFPSKFVFYFWSRKNYKIIVSLCFFTFQHLPPRFSYTFPLPDELSLTQLQNVRKRQERQSVTGSCRHSLFLQASVSWKQRVQWNRVYPQLIW